MVLALPRNFWSQIKRLFENDFWSVPYTRRMVVFGLFMFSKAFTRPFVDVALAEYVNDDDSVVCGFSAGLLVISALRAELLE